MSLRQWLWMGLLDDRPHVILALLGAVLLGICTVAAAAYFVTRAVGQ
jgi:hypothetical protein